MQRVPQLQQLQLDHCLPGASTGDEKSLRSYFTVVSVSALTGERHYAMSPTPESTRLDGISRRAFLHACAGGLGTVGLAGCISEDSSPEPDTPGTDTAIPEDDHAMELDLDTLEAETEVGTLQAQRAGNSYVAWIDDGEAIGIAFLDDIGARADNEIVVHLYDSQRLAVMLGAIDAEGAATLESEEPSDFEATADLVVEDDAVTGTVTVAGEEPTEFTADAATGVSGVYWAHGTEEDPDTRGSWVVLSDGRQWGCACVIPYTGPCCTCCLLN